MKLATRLTILFLLTAILPTAIVGYVSYDIGKRAILQQTTDHLVSTNILKSRELERWIENSKSSIEELAQRPLVVQYASVMAASHEMQDSSYREAHKNIIENHLKLRLHYGIFLELFVMCSSQGHISASTNVKQDGKHRNTRRYFIEGKTRTYVESSYYSPSLEQPAMTVSTPVKDAKGNTVAVLAGRLNLGELSEIMVWQSGKSETLDTYLVNSFNFFVSEPRFGKDYILKKAIRTEGINAGLSGKDGIGFYNDYRGVSVIGAYKWLPEFKMCLITEIDQSEAFAPVVRLAWIAVGSVIAICIAAVFLGFFFALTISRPLNLLAEGAEMIGGGNLEYRININRNDELGDLARATNEMAAKLKETHTSVKNLEKEIAERRQAEESARLLEHRYRILFDEAPAMYVITRSKEGSPIIEDCNALFLSVLGYTYEEVMEHPLADFYTPESRAELLERGGYRRALSGSFGKAERQLVTRDGQIIKTLLSAMPESDANGRVIGTRAMFVDITERKRAEEEIRMLNTELDLRVQERTAQLETANKELEAFSYSVSHDLRSPLQHLTGYTQLLEKRAAGLLDEKNKHYLKIIVDSAIRMGRLIDDLLAFSRMGRAEMLKRKTDLDNLVKEVLREYQEDTRGRNIDWKVGTLPEVYGDSSMLRQVFVNLISNAFKFTRKCDKAEIEIGSVCSESGEMCIFVKDNGAGFDMKYVDKLFGIFQRLHRTDEFEGTGIGLANVRRIIHRHGGRVWAEGKVGEGATFFFTLSA
jgi:PAS domain S-box-containing protein